MGVFVVVSEKLGVQAHFLVKTVSHIDDEAVNISHYVMLLYGCVFGFRGLHFMVLTGLLEEPKEQNSTVDQWVHLY